MFWLPQQTSFQIVGKVIQIQSAINVQQYLSDKEVKEGKKEGQKEGGGKRSEDTLVEPTC
jgi:hypothetical protein